MIGDHCKKKRERERERKVVGDHCRVWTCEKKNPERREEIDIYDGKLCVCMAFGFEKSKVKIVGIKKN